MTTIYLHDFARPLAERAKSRKVCGPYQWTPSAPGKGRGFYMGREMECADHGAGFRLRLEPASDHVGGRLADTRGYYCDRHCDGDTLQPLIARLPRSRGFLAGWTMGANMASALDSYIWDNERDAAHEAYRMAEADAEREIEYQEEQEQEDEDEEDEEDDEDE